MFKDSMSILVILCLTVVMILSVAADVHKNINVNETNLTVNNTMLNNTSLSNVSVNNSSINAVSYNNKTNGYPISLPRNISSALITFQIDNGTEIGHPGNEAGHARYTFNLGSLATKATKKPAKDLEKVVFICNVI